MRLTIDHRTRYRFSQPQARVVQLARMTPHDHTGQTVLNWHIDVDRDVRLRDGRDGYGNWTTMFYLDGPIEALEIRVQGEVLTSDENGRVSGAVETLPPLFFLRATPLTEPTEAITRFVEQTCGGLNAKHDRARALNTALCERLTLQAERTPKSRTPDETLTQGWGNVRDSAQLLVACARVAGLPARFVSGHCLDGPNVSGHKSAHCWAEIHVEGPGWMGFDPALGRSPGEMYVRVAIGLDARDATPLSGTRTGGGIEELDVDVQVSRQGMQ
jgi:transglutaminase-like putative cysteine protease